ncbi:MAG: acyl-CoA dehydrogenase family protein [Deltaproteobacteria bacterium]|nr:acyl-CoA dehydrogenase family protein [Deltaproteobacteria bacterium]
MDYRLTEDQMAIKKEFEDFFEEEMKNAPPGVPLTGIEGAFMTDEGTVFARYMAKRMGEKGYLSRPWPKEYGGIEASMMDQAIFNEVRAVYDAPGMDTFGLGMLAPTLLIGGTQEQKQRLLPPIAKGEVFYCQGWSEPDAGSDLASLTTLAIKDGEHYVVNGQKIWTSLAHRADRMFLLARTDPDSQRSKGLSVFVLSMDDPGIEVRPILYMDNAHVYNEVFFKDVRVHERDRIGPEHGGWELTRQTMNFERSGLERFVFGKITLQRIIDYVKTTKRDGKFLSENPVIRRKIAGLFADLEAGTALSQKILWLQEQGGLAMAATLPSEGKLFTTELNQRMYEFATEIMGLYGQVFDSKWAPLGSMLSHHMFAPGNNIAAGSSEIQRNLIAWVGLGLPRFK